MFPLILKHRSEGKCDLERFLHEEGGPKSDSPDDLQKSTVVSFERTNSRQDVQRRRGRDKPRKTHLCLERFNLMASKGDGFIHLKTPLSDTFSPFGLLFFILYGFSFVLLNALIPPLLFSLRLFSFFFPFFSFLSVFSGRIPIFLLRRSVTKLADARGTDANCQETGAEVKNGQESISHLLL